MISIPIIFSAPEFTKDLQAVFPETMIFPFSESIEECHTQLAKIDKQGKKRAWILFQSANNHSENVIVKDHINLSGENSLIGPADFNPGPRFPDMSSVYENDGKGIVVVLGKDRDLKNFQESWVPVNGGVWEAIALKQRGYNIIAWVISDLKKWVSDL